MMLIDSCYSGWRTLWHAVRSSGVRNAKARAGWGAEVDELSSRHFCETFRLKCSLSIEQMGLREERRKKERGEGAKENKEKERKEGRKRNKEIEI